MDYKAKLNEFMNHEMFKKVKAEGNKEARTIVAEVIKRYRKAIRQAKILDDLNFFGGCMITRYHYYINKYNQMLDVNKERRLWILGEFGIKFKIYVTKVGGGYYFSSLVPCNIHNNNEPLSQFSKSYAEGFHTVSERKLLELVTEDLARFNVEVIVE